MLGTSFVEFKLNYSGTKNLPIGEYIVDIGSILAGGRSWTIRCYPRGSFRDLSNNGDYLSLYAGTTSKSRHGVKAVFQAFPVGRDGAPSLSHAKWSSEIAAGGPNRTPVIGWHKFMKRSELESSCYLVDGCVTFVCGIIDLNGNDRVPVPPTDLVDHLGHLLECTDGSDVSFSVGGETFCAHRAILAARSPVFKAQLFGSMADAQMDRITLHDVQPAAFRILLRFLYTDALPSDTELVKDLESSSAIDLLQHLLAAADMYQLDRLKLMCAQKLWDRVSPETVAAMLVSAEMHNCPELKKRCIDFFVEEKNFRSAALTEGYLRLMQGFPSVIDEIRARLVQP
jgi:speckle-type POZ protein